MEPGISQPGCAESVFSAHTCVHRWGGGGETQKKINIHRAVFFLLEIPHLVLGESAQMVTLEVRWECRRTSKEGRLCRNGTKRDCNTSLQPNKRLQSAAVLGSGLSWVLCESGFWF